MTACSDRNFLYTVIKDASARKLFSLLNSISGSKDLVLDSQLICSLDYIANFSQLKSCNVQKVFKLESGATPGATEKCVYVIRPSIQNAKIIADHINASKSIESNKKFWVIHVPRKNFRSELVLEREGVYGYITQIELPICFFALDKDLFSLELPDFFNAFYLKGDLSYIHTAATALVQLCKICGPIPKIFGQGRCAEMVVDLMKQISEETVNDSQQTDRISHLIILDRDIDFVSVLLSQLTYEGMLDEAFGINSSRIIFPKEVTGKDDAIKVVLNSNDLIFAEIRNSFFASVFGVLSSRAKELQTKSETRNMSVADMKNFVTNDMKKIRQLQSSLSLHIGACEAIMEKKSQDNFQEHLQIERDIIENQNAKDCIDYIEDLINQQEPYTIALRLMCLLSIAQDGLLPSEYKSLATQFRQSYGCKYLPLLYNLKKLGLLVEQSSLLPSGQTTAGKIVEKVGRVGASRIAEKVATAVTLTKYSSFKSILRKFNLIPNEQDSDLRNPKSVSYVFGGRYVPLIARVTEQVIVHGSLKNIEDGMKLLPGKTIMNFQVDKDSGTVRPTTDFVSKTVLVYALGGITFAEIAALRHLGQLNGCRILLATTSIINGTSLLKMFTPSEK
ncbi:vacuolar protein sorting-associated protein 33B [Parasteatoda tepidariorum]|uniref:vacuolar protein sorting-associated protein 33B n=1 Tax=Parasteatoda tepidariorum TaxID=114398 RepID=UPI0039BD92E3